jgi:hypothetical protein
MTLKPSATRKFEMSSTGVSPDDSLHRLQGFGVVCKVQEFSCITVTHDD